MLKKLLHKIRRWFRNQLWQLRGYPAFDVENDDNEIMYCQDCGCIIEWGLEGPGDDIVRRAYVTASGDLFCSRCGREYDEEEERLADEEPYNGWEDPMFQAEQDYEDELTLSEPDPDGGEELDEP
jgi:hypothetical protein